MNKSPPFLHTEPHLHRLFLTEWVTGLVSAYLIESYQTLVIKNLVVCLVGKSSFRPLD